MNVAVLMFTFLTLFVQGYSCVYAEPTVEIVVSKGDSLTALAQRYLDRHSSWREIVRLHRLKNPDMIYPGQTLVVPARLLKGTPVEGVVSYARGTVEVQLTATDQWRLVGANDRIPEGASLRTGDESEAEVMYEGGHLLYLRPNTRTDITVSRNRGDVLSVRDFFLHTGKVIETIRRATGRETRSKIRTPSATCAVRGTLYRASVDEETATRVETLDGEVGVEAASQTVAVHAGEGTRIRKDEPPQTPRKLLTPPTLLNRGRPHKRLPLRLEFDSVEGAVAYRVSLTKDRDGRYPVAEKTITQGEALTVLMVEDGTYFLHLFSIDEIGLEGLPSAPEEVKVRVNPLPPLTGSPASGSEHTEESVRFTWLKVPDAASYHLQISANESFQRIVEERKDLRENEYRTGTLDHGRYFFRISSVAGDGFQGAWSDAVSFSIIPPPPVPVVETPRTDGNEMRMSWRNLGEGITYRFQMARDAGFSVLLIDRKLESPEITIPTPAEPGTYFVRTSAIDIRAHESAFSKPQSFEVKKRLPYALFGLLGALALTLILLF